MRRIVMLITLAATACSPLRTFDAMIPKDAGARRVVRSAAFGQDPRQRLDVYAPTATGTEGLPIIVFFYGGSWNSGTKDGYSFVGRALAARGFVVVIPDYRVVPQVRYPRFLEDNAASVRWAIANARVFRGDPKRVLLAGHSAGAYNAAMLAIDPRRLGADREAVRGLIGLAGPYNFVPFRVPVVKAAFAGVSNPADTQPVNHVSRSDPPAFLASGDKDEIVSPADSDDLEAKLTAAGVAVDRHRYARVGHVGLLTAIASPLRSRAAVLDDMVAFARRVAPDHQEGGSSRAP
jgi:acetyl esterase/lipase